MTRRARPLLLAALGLIAAGLACARAPEALRSAAADAPRRIAVMAPSAAETLTLLGESSRIVAIGDFVEPPAGRTLPRLGAYDAPSAEALLALDVDLLLTSASAAGSAERAGLERLGIRVLAVDTASFRGTLEAIVEIGRAVGRAEAARDLAAGIEQRLERVRTTAAALPKRRVLVVVGREPLFVAGPGSHLDELVALAGGTNIAADALASYAMVSLEAMLARRPEVILDSADNRATGPFGAILGEWQRWPFLPAVAEHRVFRLEPSRLLIPGPRLGEMAERMGRLIHPEAFGAPRADDYAPAAPPAPGDGR